MKTEFSKFGFEPLDWHLAKVLTRGTSAAKNVELAIMLTSKRCREGHVCASLSDVAGLPLRMTELAFEPEPCDISWPPLKAWLDELEASDLVTRQEAFDPSRPLVLAGDRVYLARYYLHEMALSQRISERISQPLPAVEPAMARNSIERLFSPLHPNSELQRLAIALALVSRFSVITGGPGTGKTTTIIKLLAVLIERSLSESQRMPSILLLAPTGKAASRIAESIRQSKDPLPTTDLVKRAIPEAASTIHRALGPAARAGSTTGKQISADIVIVDEASMVDLALMRRLFDACVSVPRLVLLGDTEQLESVLAGSVLSELTAKSQTGYSRPRAELLTSMTGIRVTESGRDSPTLDDCRIELTVSHRFAATGSIGRLAQSIRAGKGADAFTILQSGGNEAQFIELAHNDAQSAKAVLDLAEDGYRVFRAATTPQKAVEALLQFRVLCGHRQGPLGIEAINAALAVSRRGRHSPIPILITENAPSVSLFNGDFGVIWPPSDTTRDGQAYVRTADGELRSFSTRRLPAHEMAFAMTVHKSQGSEIERIAFVLPRPNSPLLTRELLYTALTRARSGCTIIGTKEALIQACERKSRRFAGLAIRLNAELP